MGGELRLVDSESTYCRKIIPFWRFGVCLRVSCLKLKVLASSSQAGLVTEWSTWLNGNE
jgi:hypothetical protein